MSTLWNSQPNELCIVFGAFMAYWIVDLAARKVWPMLLPAELFKGTKPAMILGRHTMDCVAMMLFIYLAWVAEQHPQFKALSELSPVERTYGGNPICQWLVLCQVAYQAKNLIDSYMCGDGALFYIHHVGTGVLCMFGTHPFLHAYAPFFLGWVEISTGLLCVLGLFDDDHGVVGLGAMYPKTKVILGIIFGVVFTPIRCIIWPYLSYYFWQDMLAVMEAGPHSWPAVIYALIANAGLTTLQFYWLFFEICPIAKKELGGILSSLNGADGKERSKIE